MITKLYILKISFDRAFEEISFRSIFYDKSQLSHSNNCTSDERIQNRQAGLIKLNKAKCKR